MLTKYVISLFASATSNGNRRMYSYFCQVDYVFAFASLSVCQQDNSESC